MLPCPTRKICPLLPSRNAMTLGRTAFAHCSWQLRIVMRPLKVCPLPQFQGNEHEPLSMVRQMPTACKNLPHAALHVAALHRRRCAPGSAQACASSGCFQCKKSFFRRVRLSLATSPRQRKEKALTGTHCKGLLFFGASQENRTLHLLITNQLLYRMS